MRMGPAFNKKSINRVIMPPSSDLNNAASTTERLNLKWKGLAANLAGTLSSEVTDLGNSLRSHHSNQFHEKFRENDVTKKNSTTGDVLLLGVNGTSFRAHRLVLAAASEFLKTVLLQYPIGEEPVVSLDQMSAETMVDLMDYLYRGQVSLSPRRLDNLIGWGKSLAIKGILELDFNNCSNNNNNNNNTDPSPPLAHLRPETSSSSAAITPWSSMRSGHQLVGSSPSSWPPSTLLSPSVSTGLSLLASAALESDHQQQVQHDHVVVAAAARQRRFSSSNDENNSLNGNNAINLSLKANAHNHYYSEMDNNTTTLTIKPTTQTSIPASVSAPTDQSCSGFKPVVQYNHYPKAHLLNIPNPSSLKWKMSRAMSAANNCNSNVTSPSSSGIGTSHIMDIDRISDVTDEDVLTIDMSSATTPPQEQTNPSADHHQLHHTAGSTMDHVVGLPATPSPSPSSIGNSLLEPKMIFQTTETSGNGINYSDSTTASAGLSFGGLRPVLPPSTLTMSNGYDHDEEIVDPSEMASDLRGRQNSESLSQSSNGEGKKWKSRQPKLCVHCDRYFSNQFNLKQHILNMHTIGGDVRCDKCNKTVKNKWYLRRHHVTHHNAPLKK